MQFTSYHYEVVAGVSFTKAEVTTLVAMARTHYDASVKALATPGGRLYGLLNELQAIDDAGEPCVTYRGEFRDFDLLNKACENCTSLSLDEVKVARTLIQGLSKLLGDLKAEFERVNLDKPKAL